MSSRDAVRMTPAEIAAFLDEPRTLNSATIGSDGAIHIVAMWFVMDGLSPVFTTYAKSQKVANLRRDSRMSGLVESGSEYTELRGVELIGTARILDDPSDVLRVVQHCSAKYTGRSPGQEAEQVAAKRVAIALDPERTISWDHRKLVRRGSHTGGSVYNAV